MFKKPERRFRIFAIKKMKQLMITLTLAAILPFSLRSQSKAAEFEKAADEFYRSVLEQIPGLPGFTIAVVKGDELTYLRGFGQASIDPPVAAGPEVEYYIASSTKSFTGLLAALLDAKGILDLDASLASFFPDARLDPGLEADKILLRDLLTHTSGLSNDPIGFRSAYSGDHDLKTLLSLVEESEPNESGRGQYEYTNTGYNIYTLILERETGKSWKDWLDELIFTPLGMDHTSGYISEAERKGWPQAKPYLSWSAENMEEVYLKKKDNTMQSAGGLITTTGDLARWLRMQMNDGQLDGKQVIPAEIVEMARQPMAANDESRDEFKPDGYGLGWQSGAYHDHRVVWHFGGFPGFFTHISYLPEQDLGVAVMVNEAISGNHLMNLLAYYAYDWWLRPESLEGRKEELTQIRERSQQISQRISAHNADRAKRTWQLEHPFAKYNGEYYNPKYGAITIRGQKELEVAMGNLHCIAEPYTDKNSIRVELIPGAGMVVQFQLEDGKVKGFEFDGSRFERVE